MISLIVIFSYSLSKEVPFTPAADENGGATSDFSAAADERNELASRKESTWWPLCKIHVHRREEITVSKHVLPKIEFLIQYRAPLVRDPHILVHLRRFE